MGFVRGRLGIWPPRLIPGEEMARPTILVVDSDEARRRELARGLSGYSYEVVTAGDADEGARFAAGLGPGIIVTEASLTGFSDPKALTALLAGEPPHPVPVVLEHRSGDAAGADDWPEQVIVVAVAGLTPGAILRKLRTLLIGRELGLEPDSRLESLLCDLSVTPLFDLLPMLQKVILAGRVVLREGEMVLSEGQVLAARSGRTRGVKAFCRLARVGGGTARILPGPAGVDMDIGKDLLSLMALAMEDQHRAEEAKACLPGFGCRVRVEMGPAFFATQFTTTQQALLAAAGNRPSIWQLLDAVDAPDGDVLGALVQLKERGFLGFDEAEGAVVVVTDSASDLNAGMARGHAIQVVPASLVVGDAVFKDGLDTTAAKVFDAQVGRKGAPPRTSPPSRGELSAAFRSLLPRADVVAIHTSEGLSQTVVHARAAADEVREEIATIRSGGGLASLEVVDSGKVSIGLGLVALFAARMAHRGLPAREIAERIRAMADRVHVLFYLDDLDSVTRGGRLAQAPGIVGGLLGLRPVLGVVHGELGVVDRVRGSKRLLPRMVEILKGLIDPQRAVVVGVTHGRAVAEAAALKKLVEESFQVAELVDGETSAATAAHSGPGSVALAVFQPSVEETDLIAPL